MNRLFSYPKEIHKLKTTSKGEETILVDGNKHHIVVDNDVIIAYVNEKDESFFCLKLMGVEPINNLFEKCGINLKFNNILEF